MHQKTCRCGKSSQPFKIDIGPFYIDSCCEEAGFDNLGNLKETATPLDSVVTTTPSTTEVIETKPVEVVDRKMTPQEVLVQLTVKQLLELATSKNIEVPKYSKKPAIIELILKNGN